MTQRKRTKAEEQSYAALRDVLLEIEISELEQWNAYRKLKERAIPGAWRAVEREVPVRPKKIR